MFVGSSANATLIAVLMISAMLATVSGCSDATAQNASAGTASSTEAPFAVVELFTSEGCSSCPPADKLLSALAEDARENDTPVYLLAFHVDYWDGLGWQDPYADATYTRRQRQYAEHFAARGLYTPQMIVNGKAEFVGSNKTRAKREIDRALKQPVRAVIALSGLVRGGKTATVNYVVSSVPANALLQVAVVERGLVTDVPRGENAGRNLLHDNVVRHFQTIMLDGVGNGTAELELSTLLQPENSSIIVYVQDAGDMSILGAVSLSLGGAATKPVSAAR